MLLTKTYSFRNFREKFDKVNPTILLVFLFIITFLPNIIVYNRTHAAGDIAEYINNPLRIIYGELPYRDFWLIFPPGEVFLPAFIYKVFGLNVNILLALTIFLNSFISVSSFLVARQIFKDNFFSSVATILVIFNGLRHYGGFIYIHVYFLFLLISAFFLLRYLKDEKLTNLFLTGVFLGLASLFKLYEVGAASLSFLLLVLIWAKLEKKKIKSIATMLFILFAGSFLFPVITSIILIDIWKEMLRWVLIESVLHGTSMNLPYFTDSRWYLDRILEDFGSIKVGHYYKIRLFHDIIGLIYTTTSYLLPFIILATSIFYLLYGRYLKNERYIIMLFLLWGFFTFPKSFGRSDMSHLVISINPLFFLVAFFLWKSMQDFNKNLFNKVLRSAYAIITLLLLLSVPHFFIYIAFQLKTYRHPVEAKYGTLLFKDHSDAENVNAVIKYIDENTNEGDYIFVTPWFAPPLYALTNRRNPTYYDSLIDPIVLPSEEKQLKICDDLLRKNTKLVIHYPDFGYSAGHFMSSCPMLQKCIEENFDLVVKYGNYWIYKRKEKIRNFE